MREALVRARRTRPQLTRRLVLHATDEPPPSLDGVGVVVFWLSAPLKGRFPACYDAAVAIADAARSRGLPLVNAPEALSNALKSKQARLWREAGINTPHVDRFENYEELKQGIGRLAFPLFVRGDQNHTQRGARVIRTMQEFEALQPAAFPFPCAISPFVDVREGRGQSDAQAAFRKYFHKKRLIVANGLIRTKHVLFADNPIVSSRSSVFAKHRDWFGLGFHPFLSSMDRQCIRHDIAFWRKGEEHRKIMVRACAALGVELAAIDYSDLADGSPILWEANPLFHIPRLKEVMLPRQRLATERIESYLETIVEFLDRLPAAQPVPLAIR